MSKSSSRNPMELIDRYLQAVRFWLPKNAKQEDLLAELGEDLHSQIEAKEDELARPMDQAEVSAILKACGNPMRVASRLGPQRYLIGPTLFPIYLFVLKMVLLCILLPVFVFILGPINFANSGGNLAQAILATFGGLWSGGFVAAAVITLVFATLEATHAVAGIECKWDPAKLPSIEKRPRKTSFVHTVSELFFNIFGIVWLLLIPQHPFMILGPAAAFLHPGPIWQKFYWPIVLVAAFAVLRLIFILARPQWKLWPLFSQALQELFSLTVIAYMLATVRQIPSANSYPFVTLADSVKNSAHFIPIAAIVNVSMLIAVLGIGVASAIAIILHSWQLLSQARKQASSNHQPASLQAR
jgi:hypothetical protein